MNTVTLPQQAPGKLHRVFGRNRFCGPAVLSSIFNIPTHDAAKYIRLATGRTKVMGLYNKEMLKTLDKNNINYTTIQSSVPKGQRNQCKTINQFITTTLPGIYIVAAANHYVAIDTINNTHADSGFWDAKKPKPLSEIAKPKARVKFAIKITSGALPRLSPKPPATSSTSPATKFKPQAPIDIIKRFATDELHSEMRHMMDMCESYFEDEALVDLTKEQIDSMDMPARVAHYCDQPSTVDMHVNLLQGVWENMAESMEPESQQAYKTIRMLLGRHKMIPKADPIS